MKLTETAPNRFTTGRPDGKSIAPRIAAAGGLVVTGAVLWTCIRPQPEQPTAIITVSASEEPPTLSATSNTYFENPYDRLYLDRSTNYYGKYLEGDITSDRMRLTDTVDTVIAIKSFRSSELSHNVIFRNHPSQNDPLDPREVAPEQLDPKGLYVVRISGTEYNSPGTAGSVRTSLNGGEKRVGVWYMVVKLFNTQDGIKVVAVDPNTHKMLEPTDYPFVIARPFFEAGVTFSLQAMNTPTPVPTTVASHDK